MIGEDGAKAVLERSIGYSTADQTEAVLVTHESDLTRFANSAINQNVAEWDATLHIRAVIAKRVGEATTNDLSDVAIKHAVKTAIEIAKLQADNPDFVSLPVATHPRPSAAFIPRTANCSPEERARLVAVVCDQARREGLCAAGACSTESNELAVANSLGVSAYHAQTVADLSTVVMADDSSGYAHRVALDVGTIDPELVAEEAVGKALRGRQPIAVAPGEYEVILEPYAVQDILVFLAYLGLNALAVKEKRSFMDGHFGKRLVGENVSVCDDGLDPLGLPMPFDFEGVPKQHVDFFVDGIARDVVYDSYLASQAGRQSTGHALPSPIVSGPLPLNIFMRGGDATIAELIRSVKHGLWVTRFWYTRPVQMLQAIVTGMTRDGTFLIENGEIVGPVKNLRFTQGYLTALNEVEGISRETSLVREEAIAVRAPTIKVGRWHFVSATEY